MRLSESEYKKLYSDGHIAEWFLRPDQLELYDKLIENNKTVVEEHRRCGKTTTVLTFIDEVALTNKINVRLGGITQTKMHEIYNSCQDKIFFYYPKLQPKWYNDEGCYVFKETGSKIFLFGNSTSEENKKSRGSESDIIYCDEFGFWKFKPKETLYSVLIPQLQHSKIDKLILTSTMPKDLTHEYLNQCKEARVRGYFYFQNIDDSVKKGVYTQAQYKKIEEDMGGRDSEDFRREYLLEEVASTKYLVIPEAQDESKYVGVTDRPMFHNPYVAIDLGLRDFTACLFGYYDFINSRYVIEDEYIENYKTTEEVVASCKDIESKLNWVKPPVRYSDCEQQQIWDMNNSFKYGVSAVIKRKKEADKRYLESLINGLRIAIKAGFILINPKCVNTISQLKYGIWEDNRQDFERTESMGHLDALMALAYGWDMLDKKNNPYPVLPAGVRDETHYISPELKNQNNTSQQKLAKIFGRK